MFIGSLFLFRAVFGTTSAAFSSGDVSALASLVAFVYASWIGFITWEEYTDRNLSRSIRERPSIATVNDAFGLLQSNDDEARINASYCLSAVVSTSPKNVVNTTAAPNEEIVEYLLPYLRDDDPEISDNVGNVVAFMARDYPQSVEPFRDRLLKLIQRDVLTGDVRGNLTLAIGFLTLSEGTDSDLAGLSNRKARQRLQEMARSDPEQEVREHAEELV
ncbi:hypothetical protein BRC64_03535 [Halobacteriales archaeon QH_10_67_22]|nr:MAG: hypothetical protein BRC64_03535 [Halobacteriales archaeon QH_10_67_22]